MANIADLLKKLAEKSGIDITTEDFKPTLEVISKLELPENADFLSAYILKNDAKNDPEIKNHFYGQFANQFDSAVFKSFGDLGIDRDALEEIKKSEPSSFKRIDTLTAKAKEYIAKIADPSTLKGEKAEIQKKLEEALNEKRLLLETHENEKRQLVDLRENDMIQYQLEKASRDFKLIDIPYRDTIATQSIQKSLDDHGVKVLLKDGKVALVNASDPTLSPKDGVTLKSIIEKGFANDKLLDLGVPATTTAATVATKTTSINHDSKKNALSSNIEKARAMNAPQV